MLFVADHCGCQREVGMTKARDPQRCEHGNLYRYAKALGPAAASSGSKGSTPRRGRKPLRRSGLKRSQPKRDWTDARAKVEEEGCCRICKRSDRKLEAAHILGREHDEPKVKVGSDGKSFTGSKTLYVHPDRIVPLCGPFPEGCHGDVDYHRVNLVHVLTLDEQLQAVKDAGGIAEAWRALAPVDYRAELVVRPRAMSPSFSPASGT